jgi:hypothetical protein
MAAASATVTPRWASIEVGAGAALFASSARRLADLCPDSPRSYGVVWIPGENKRRWWPLADLLGDRFEQMYQRALRDLLTPEKAARQMASMVIHGVVGTVTALVVLDGRAWDPGIDNLWMHSDSDGAIDWAGIVDPTLRLLVDEPGAGVRGTVTLPCEQALLTWTAHRCVTTLRPLLATVVARARADGAAVDASMLWGMVGESVMGTAAYVPALAGVGEAVALARGRGLMDAMVTEGVPVRAHASPVRMRWTRDAGAPSTGEGCRHQCVPRRVELRV